MAVAILGRTVKAIKLAAPTTRPGHSLVALVRGAARPFQVAPWPVWWRRAESTVIAA
jgi:hypothetical protein